jgi:hypothetical protein
MAGVRYDVVLSMPHAKTRRAGAWRDPGSQRAVAPWLPRAERSGYR